MIAAPCDLETGKSRDLSVALANRSAVLFSLKAYPMALDDIRLAFESGYPEELRFKLIERKVWLSFLNYVMRLIEGKKRISFSMV